MNDDENNGSIDDLITYSDDDSAEGFAEDFAENFAEEAPEEEVAAPYDTEDADDGAKEENIEDIDVPYYIEENSLSYSEEKDRGWIAGAVLGVLAGLAVIVIFLSINTGIIGTYKENFSNNFSSIFANFIPDENEYPADNAKKTQTQYKSAVKSSIIVAPEDAAGAVYVSYKNGFLCASQNHLSYISYGGETIWETDTAIVEPLLAAEGNYILLAEKDRNKLCLYSDNKLLYDVDDTDNIMAVKVSARGDAALVTDKASYRGGVSVYNKAGEQIYAWASGHDIVISADIASSSRRVAVALLDTETRAHSVVQLFDINQPQSYSQTNIEDTVIYNVEFSGSMLTAFGDNRLMTFTDGGSIITDIAFDEDTLTHSAMDIDGNKLLSFDNGVSPQLVTYTRRGTQREVIQTGSSPDFIDISGKSLLFSEGRDIYFGSGASKMIKYTAAMDIKKLILLKENTYAIVYSNSVEIISV